MRINHNVPALNTYNQYSKNITNSSKSMEKLSSGLRINRAADDAAGLSISEKMRSQIKGLSQAVRNAQDGVSFIQTAEGALSEVSDMLVRVKELSVQVQNGTYDQADQANIGLEMKALGTAVNDILTKTTFNSINVFKDGADITYGESGAQSVIIAASPATEVDSSTAVLKSLTDAAVGIKALTVGEQGTAGITDADTAATAAGVKADTAVTNAATATGLTGTATFVSTPVAGDITAAATAVGTANTAAISANTDVKAAAADLATAAAKAGVSDVAAVKSATDLVNSTALTAASAMTAAANAIAAETGGSDGAAATAVKNASTLVATAADAVKAASNAVKAAALAVKTAATNGSVANPTGVTVAAVESAISEINTQRATYGAQQNQLEHVVNNLGTTGENIQAAESRIRDVDMAQEMSQFTKTNILVQAAQAMLAQANAQPQGVLQLLKG